MRKFLRTTPRRLREFMRFSLFRIINDTCHSEDIVIEWNHNGLEICKIINEEIESIKSNQKTLEILNMPEESTKEKVFPYNNVQYLTTN